MAFMRNPDSAPGDTSNQPGKEGQMGSSSSPQQNPPQQNPPQQSPPQQSPPAAAQATTPSQPQANPYRYKPRRASIGSILKPIIILVVIVAIIGGGYYAYKNFGSAPAKPPPPVINTTKNVTLVKLLGCANITSPGLYYLGRNITTSIAQGSCITIKSNNVRLIGDGAGVQGNGPYVATAPPTYGITLDAVSNVSINGVAVSRFSYDIYVNNSNGAAITNSSVKTSTLSGIYLLNSPFTVMNNDNVSQVASNFGAISLQGGGNSIVSNSIIQDNAYYGIVVNSSGNKFFTDNLLNNPVDFVCVKTNGLRSYNNYSQSRCEFNAYCNFVSCFESNLEYNMSNIKINPSVNTCGVISNPGTYTLKHNLNLSLYANTLIGPQAAQPCLAVYASNVKINCNGYSILNSGYGVLALGGSIGAYNITLNDCKFNNDTTGVRISHVFNPNITNSNFQNTVYGIFLTNVTTGTVANITASRNGYAVYVNSSIGVVYSGLNLQNNTYGLYVQSGGGNIYRNEKLLSNIKTDLFCSAATYNVTSNIYQNVNCGKTNCSWGTSCSTHILPPLKTFYLSNCTTIVASGSYSLSSSLLGRPNCINVQAANVTFSCNGFNIISNGNGGSGVYIADEKNVSVSNCYLYGFAQGVTVLNSSVITINAMSINESPVGFLAENVALMHASNVLVQHYLSSAFNFNRLTQSVVTNDTAAGIGNSQTGFIFFGASNNLISFDTAQENQQYGFSFTASQFNNVFNNTAMSNAAYDYFCAPDTSGLYSETDGINSGLTKERCRWLVELEPYNLRPTCYTINSPGKTIISADMLYTYGSTCYSIYNSGNESANGDVINCNNHTILSNSGGTFVDVFNSTGVTIENCYLKNFTTPVIASANSIKLFNNTFASSSNSSVYIYNLRSANISNNLFENESYGVLSQNTIGGRCRRLYSGSLSLLCLD